MSSSDGVRRRCGTVPQLQQQMQVARRNLQTVVADHEHDGNELQVTQGFQKHVAQKLGAILDSVIAEKQSTARPPVNTQATDIKDEEDEGFRLFSTSVPGQTFEEPPPPKRPIPSSSDSDSEMEMRLKEAAISIKDFFPASALELQTKSSTLGTPNDTKQNIKKKKKKPNPQQATKCTSDNPGKHSAQEDKAQTTIKLKKKKRSTLGNSDVDVPCL
ncbi:protein CUSTOS isoform X2 [Eucyclogobius newberryi]|uniref:protein CUSTOS isoform X2 n=1 Tax=Eucyclogobius newberryi TaxID=166745 RepID=UPI003B5B355E